MAKAEGVDKPRAAQTHVSFRLPPDVLAALDAQVAGNMTRTDFIRDCIMGRVRSDRTELRKVAALHVLGRRIQSLQGIADATAITETLAAVRDAISRLAAELP